MLAFLKKKSRKKVPDSLLISPTPSRSFEIRDDTFGSSGDQASEPVVISYGTRDGKYDVFSERLRQSCEEAGHECSFETIPDCGRRNACLFKPTFIKMKLLTLGRPVIWMDADGVVRDRINLPDGNWDIASLANDRSDDINEKAVVCIAFRPTVAALRFIEYWEELCSAFWLEPGLDHRRFNYAREVLAGQYNEIELHPSIEGKIVRDVGASKENAF